MPDASVIQREPAKSALVNSRPQAQLEQLIAEIRLAPGDPFENLLRVLVRLMELSYATPEAAAQKMDLAFEKNLLTLREKLAAEFAAGAEQVRAGNLAGGTEILDAAEKLRQVGGYLHKHNQQLIASRENLEKAADLLADRWLQRMQERVLPSLDRFEKTVAETGGKVAAEYREMNEISRRKISGVRLWSRLIYGWMFAGTVLLWLACVLTTSFWLESRYARAYDESVAEVRELYVGNNAALKTLAAAKVRLIVEEKRDGTDQPIPGRYVLAVPSAVDVYKKNGYGVIVFQEPK